jgi:hypothetical protein
MHAFGFFGDAGGLMSYGATQSEVYTMAAEQAQKSWTALGRVSCRCDRRRGSSWSSTTGLRRRSASQSRPRCCCGAQQARRQPCYANKFAPVLSGGASGRQVRGEFGMFALITAREDHIGPSDTPCPHPRTGRHGQPRPHQVRRPSLSTQPGPNRIQRRYRQTEPGPLGTLPRASYGSVLGPEKCCRIP